MVQLLISPEQATNWLTKASFWDFVKEFWDIAVTEPLIPNWHMEYMCNELQKCAERVMAGIDNPHDLVINVPPGTSKSVICSQMFPAWVWTRMPRARFICVSYKYDVAHDQARRCKDIIESDKYQATFPEVGKLRNDARSTGMFLNNAGGFRLCSGTGGVTGFHAHFILVDDPVDPQELDSEPARKSAIKWMSAVLPSRKVNKSVAVTVCVMQRIHEEDPSGLMLGELKTRKWGHPVLHICLPWKDSEAVRPVELRVKYQMQGGLLDPKRLPENVAKAFKTKMGTYQFSCQFEQKPSPEAGGQFNVTKFQFGVKPIRFKKKVRYWDKAGTLLAGDFTAGVLMAEDFEGRFWVLDVVVGQWEAAERERVIRMTAEKDGRKVSIGIEIEPGSGGKESGQNTIRRTLRGFHVVPYRPTGPKTARADPFATQVNDGNVWIPTDSEWFAHYCDELKLFPSGSHDDQVDGSSGAFGMLNNKKKAGAWEGSRN